MVAESVVTSTNDLIEFMNDNPKLTVSGNGTHSRFRRPPDSSAFPMRIALSGITRHDVDDQIVVVQANTPLADLQEALFAKNQCLPYLPFYAAHGHDIRKVEGTVAGHLSMNLPHAYGYDFGTWKEWLLGAKVILSNGLRAKCGSQVVKNVAGYDLHKFLVGSRGTLAVFTELTLKTLPIGALGPPDSNLTGKSMGLSGRIYKTLPSHFDSLREAVADRIIASHPRQATLYCEVDLDETEVAIRKGWTVGWGLGEGNLILQDPTLIRYLQRAKHEFDPTGKLNGTDFGGM